MDYIRKVSFTLLLLWIVACIGAESSAVKQTIQYTVSSENRTECDPSKDPPGNRVNTTERVIALRAAMKNTTLTGLPDGQELDAYITLISDDHGTAGSAYDQRVTYISGFTGSNGYTIVTQNDAALWTDGRYFLQAEYQMECIWILMKMSTLGYPTGPVWLTEVLSDRARVGAYPNYVSIDTWQSYEKELAKKHIQLVPVPEDLVNIVWSAAEPTRPEKPKNPLIVHPDVFTGRPRIDKIDEVRKKLAEKEGAPDCLVVTVLEESAWLFNLRGTDRTDSLFYGYSIICTDSNKPSVLFVNNITRVFEDANLIQHLNLNSSNDCTLSNEGDCVKVIKPFNLNRAYSLKTHSLVEYDQMEIYINTTAQDDITKAWLDPTASFAIYNALGDRLLLPLTMSPVALMKAIKNTVEREKFFECILRDSAAVVEFMASFEPQIKRGVHWTEKTASDELKRIRSTYEHYMGVSFETISAAGPNAAVIHYRPEPGTERDITTREVYLLDSGGQYWDGTTDVTRTFHFGEPSDKIKEAYTRVLMGAIDLAQTVWPFGYYGSDIDSRARTPLWQHGWDYNHGTGHGIGYFLSVHEGPGRINIGYNPAHAPLYEGMFFSDEPGYYEDGEFGIRLETLVGIVDAQTPNKFNGKQYLGFREATLVPFESNLIKYDLLSKSQLDWLNKYHQRCVDEVGKYLLDTRKNRTAYDWLVARSQQIDLNVNKATTLTLSYGVVTIIIALPFLNFL